MKKLVLDIVKRTDPLLLREMERHYTKPKGFVGRNICYQIKYDCTVYGHIVAGSATRHLPGRDEFLRVPAKEHLNSIVNNIFFHVEPNGKYPVRNFTKKVILMWERKVSNDWLNKYGDRVVCFETLVELPRTGECYKRAGWAEVGITKGFTCKRIGGKGTDSYSGKRVWDTKNLKPKRVFCKLNDVKDYEETGT